MQQRAKTTTNHDLIRKWAERRGGQPAVVKATSRGREPGVLRIDFPGYTGAGTLKPISWEEWFEKFDQRNLQFLYQDKTATGKPSRFFKLVNKETARAGAKRAPRGRTRARTSALPATRSLRAGVRRSRGQGRAPRARSRSAQR